VSVLIRHRKTDPLGQQRADRADVGRAVCYCQRTVAQPAAVAVDQQPRADAVAADGEHLFAVDLVARAHAELAQDAAVGLEQHVGVAGVHRALGIERLVVQVGHAGALGLGLQQAVAALFATGAEVVALHKEHLQQALALRAQFGGVAVHALAGRRGRGAGGHWPAIHVHRADPAGCAGRDLGVPAEVRHLVPGALRGLQDGVAGLHGDGLAVELEHRRWVVARSAHGESSVCRWAPGSVRPVTRRADDSSASRFSSGSNRSAPVREA